MIFDPSDVLKADKADIELARNEFIRMMDHAEPDAVADLCDALAPILNNQKRANGVCALVSMLAESLPNRRDGLADGPTRRALVIAMAVFSLLKTREAIAEKGKS